MNEWMRMPGLLNGDRDLAKWFSVLHEKFGPEVLENLAAMCRPIVLASLNEIAKHNPDFVDEVVPRILKRELEPNDRKPG
ncbi:hypothetical protein A3A39_02485 [Candidatus Kaiserbacteria bacterium RIFCSPLOWO2_01_FULL_54_13]|uniref:Uncharacterized protein n=1 Tax=Candidatus Kaiserbacteria bacterium RIFCSPLOWO2_01_FULL_54_13 TaxID=1798512 RepID=A0A1F6F3E9_9BACT|nr:MAG: hypothetical protein A3A39_02485 [Candidatus Kaiserbacteria bacterium RIFCSPLOWO2_01_FULL_54_13]